jgi:hypothetical protein
MSNLGARLAAGVGQRLLRDPVDGGLAVAVQRAGVAASGHAGPHAGADPEELELGLDRRAQPVVVQGRGAQLSREAGELVHGLIGKEEASRPLLFLGPGRLFTALYFLKQCPQEPI